jgi:hypothetical protein
MASTAGARSGFSRRDRALENFPRKIPRNPLISFDSDERIQGNPTLINRGFCAETGRAKEPKLIDVMPSDKGFSAPSGSAPGS